MDYPLLALSVLDVVIAYCVCVVLVLAVTYGAARVMGSSIATGGPLFWIWQILHVAAWVAGSVLASWIILVRPIGSGAELTCIMLGALLFVMQLRATFVLKRQQPVVTQVLLCILCPLTVYLSYLYI